MASQTRAFLRLYAVTQPNDAVRQAYQLLHIGFAILPVVAGADKFFNFMVNWETYLAPTFAHLLPLGIVPNVLMHGVGIVEICAGLLVAIKPRLGAYLVAIWLLGIIVNLVVSGTHFDIALRDFGLMLGALALGRLSEHFA